MYIGNIEIKKLASLAPMAGIGDRAFREICVEQGASYVIGEMCSAKGLTYDSAKSFELLEMSEEEKPAAVQLFASEPEIMAKAVELAKRYKPQIIDINMGCPAPKIVNGGSGSALMKDLKLAGEIIKYAVVAARDTPVTVKFRKGWDEDNANAVELAVIAEEAGASAVAVHGRTKMQMYRPPIDLDIIKAVKEAVSIPVIGNGGITTLQGVIDMYEYTKCDLIMIGEGALGRPWFFAQIKAMLEGTEIPKEPSVEEKMDILRRQVEKAVEYKGEYVALKESRTHAGWYTRGLHGAATLRGGMSSLKTLNDLYEFIEKVIRTVREAEENVNV